MKKTTFYQINVNNCIINEEDSLLGDLFIINDMSMSQKKIAKDYFDTIYRVFLGKLKKFKENSQGESSKEHEDLTRAFKMLIEAKKIAYEGENDTENDFILK